MEELVQIIANVGFPIAISAYLLVRVETKMDKLSESITKLTTAIEIHKERLS